MEKTVWALLDERQGNTSQTLGVAEALGIPFETKQLAFNGLIRLPNPLLYKNTWGLTRASAALLAPPWPDVVISTARRLGLVASSIKSRSPGTFLAQIQWPGFPSRHFDLIAAPLHDGMDARGNVITTLGAPHRVTPAILRGEATRWQPKLSHLPAPRIAVLIGGGQDAQQFAENHGKPLATLSSALANALGGSLMITTSRRTGAAMCDQVEQHLTCPFTLHRWQDGAPKEDNPFYGYLGLADAVIVTGDSVSMCSEACATGKSVFIYTSPEFMSKKHAAFVAELLRRGHAKDLAQSQNSLFTPPGILNESALISIEIKKRVIL